MTECEVGAESLGEIGGNSKKGRGGPQSGVNVIQGGDTRGAPIWIRYLGPILGN